MITGVFSRAVVCFTRGEWSELLIVTVNTPGGGSLPVVVCFANSFRVDLAA